MIWDSLTSDFQLEIIGDEEDFNRVEEYDGVDLWHYILNQSNQSNPSTTTGASTFKDEIESKKMANFGDDVKAYHTWIADTRTSIIKGEGLYNEYVRSMFRTCLTVDNEEFVDAIKVEKRLWTQAK